MGESNRSVIANVYVWSNGMVMVFDQYGQQMPDYQGHISEFWAWIKRDRTPVTRLNGEAWSDALADRFEREGRSGLQWSAPVGGAE